MTDSDLTLILSVVGIAVGFLAVGLCVGLFFSLNSQPRQTSYRSGYSIERDDRGRILGILPIPVPTMEELF